MMMMMMMAIYTCQDKSDQSEEKVAAPKDDAREDDVSNKRLDTLHHNRLLLWSCEKHNLLNTTRVWISCFETLSYYFLNCRLVQQSLADMLIIIIHISNYM